MTRDDEQRARETLIAELGATLDKSVAPESARAADRRTFEDPESLALLRALRADEAALTAELDQALAGPIPERLVEAVEQGFAARAGARGGVSWGQA